MLKRRKCGNKNEKKKWYLVSINFQKHPEEEEKGPHTQNHSILYFYMLEYVYFSLLFDRKEQTTEPLKI
jgi:hypothetical protein